MATPRFAVLLAVYNGMKFLEEQIETILNQEQVSVTIFANIDKSCDGSEAWLEELAAKEARLVILPLGKRFGSASKNFFHLIRDVDFSAFDYVAFADQDDLWFKEKLFHAANKLVNSNFHAYSSNVVAFWPNGRKLKINKAQPQKSWDFLFEAAGPGCTYVFKLSLMMALKELVISNWEEIQKLSLHDWFCYAFARANSYNWFIDSKPSLLYRQHDSNFIGVNKGFKAYWKRFQDLKSGWWFQQVKLSIKILGLERNPFIKTWCRMQRKDLLRLALKANSCRRAFISRIIFFKICLLFAIIGLRREKIDLIK